MKRSDQMEDFMKMCLYVQANSIALSWIIFTRHVQCMLMELERDNDYEQAANSYIEIYTKCICTSLGTEVEVCANIIVRIHKDCENHSFKILLKTWLS